MLSSERFGRAAADDFTIRFPEGQPETSLISEWIAEYFAGIETQVVEYGPTTGVPIPVPNPSWDVRLLTLPKDRCETNTGVHEKGQSITVYMAAAHADWAFTARANGPRLIVEALAAGFVVFVREKLATLRKP